MCFTWLKLLTSAYAEVLRICPAPFCIDLVEFLL